MTAIQALVTLALYVTVLQIVVGVMIAQTWLKLDRQARALELMFEEPKRHERDIEEIRRRARVALRGGDEPKEERGTPPLILDDEYEAALEERAQKARDDG